MIPYDHTIVQYVRSIPHFGSRCLDVLASNRTDSTLREVSSRDLIPMFTNHPGEGACDILTAG